MITQAMRKFSVHPIQGGVARSVFEWALDGQFLVQRTEIPDPQVEEPDFTPLDFSQRFTGEFSPDGNTITGTWEIDEGSGWRKDFDLTYTRADG